MVIKVMSPKEIQEITNRMQTIDTSGFKIENHGDGKFELFGTNKSDLITIRPGSNTNDLEVYLNGVYDQTLPNVEQLVIHGKDGDDNIWVHADSKQFVDIRGGNGHDRITVKQGKSYIRGGRGNDVIKGGDDRDIIFGDEGNDIIDGGNSHDRLYGRKGNDKITDSSGNNFVDGGWGDDEINLVNKSEDNVHDYHGKNKIILDKKDTHLVNKSSSINQAGKANRVSVDENSTSYQELKNKIEKKYKITILNKHDRKWSYVELLQLENAFKMIPTKLSKAVEGYTFQRLPYRYGSNYDTLNIAGLHENKQISIYDAATYGGYQSRSRLVYNGMERTVIHEIAHAYEFNVMSKKQKDDFYKLSDWRKENGNWIHDEDAVFSREYSKTNPHEDWATSVGHYYAFPLTSEGTIPKKHEFINKMFRSTDSVVFRPILKFAQASPSPQSSPILQKPLADRSRSNRVKPTDWQFSGKAFTDFHFKENDKPKISEKNAIRPSGPRRVFASLKNGMSRLIRATHAVKNHYRAQQIIQNQQPLSIQHSPMLRRKT